MTTFDDASSDWAFDLAARPFRYAHIAAVEVDGHLLLAHEGCNGPLVLDAVSASIWGFLDGATTVGEIVCDLTAAFGGSEDRHRRQLEQLLIDLSGGAFIDSVRFGDPPAARRIHPPIDPSSCLGTRLGLSQGVLRQIDVDAWPVLRVGSTDPDLVASIVDALPEGTTASPVDERWVETIWARLSTGRRPRVQSISTALGDWVYATTDLQAVRDALRRSVVGLIEADRSPSLLWVKCPALLTPSGVTLLHPRVAAAAVGPLRGRLDAAGVSFAPSMILRLETREYGHVVIQPPTSVGAPDWETLPVVAIVVPRASTEVSSIDGVAQVLWRWNQRHLDAVPHLVELATPIDLSQGTSDGHVEYLAAIAHGSGGRRVRRSPAPVSPSPDRTDALARPIVERLGRPHDIERSVKVGPSRFRADRLLLSYRGDRISASLAELVALLDPTAAQPLLFPSDVVDDLRSAPWVHLGWEADGIEALLKLHIELQRQAPSTDEGATLVHRSFKWLAGSSAPSETHYLQPRVSDRSEVDRLLASYLAALTPAAAAAIHVLVREARQRSGPAEWMVLEVSEAGSRRRSLDLNLYDSGMTLSEMLPILQPLFDGYGVADPVSRLVGEHPTAPLGHLSVGSDRRGVEFVTFYYRAVEWGR